MSFQLPDHPTWTIVVIALATPALTFIGAWMKLRHDGLTAANIEEIRDRARFRTAMMERIRIVEEREQQLITRHENREKALLDQIAECHRKIEDLEERLRVETKERKNGERRQ